MGDIIFSTSKLLPQEIAIKTHVRSFVLNDNNNGDDGNNDNDNND